MKHVHDKNARLKLPDSNKKKAAAGVSLLAIMGISVGGLTLGPGTAFASTAAESTREVTGPIKPAGTEGETAVFKDLEVSDDAEGERVEVQNVDDSLSAYFDAGYDYDDAVQLAEIWGLETWFDAKVKAGGLLISGGDVPIEPGSAPDASRGPEDGVGERAETQAVDDSLSAFFDAGYDYDDAVQLAEIWGLETPYDAKIEAGDLLISDKDVPIEPGSAPDAPDVPVDDSYVSLDPYFDAGYDYDDAVELAEIWGLETPFDAKVMAKGLLISGGDVPNEPGS